MHRAATIHPILLEGLHDILSIDPNKVDGSSNFITLGGDSLAAVRLATYCTERQVPVLVRDIIQSSRLDQIIKDGSKDIQSQNVPVQHSPKEWRSDPPVEDLANNMPSLLESLKTNPPSPPASKPESERADEDTNDISAFEEAAFTDMQLSFIHESENQPGTNIIRFSQSYPSDILPAIRRAWETVIKRETIFHPPRIRTDGDDAHDQWTNVVVNSEEDYGRELVKAKHARTSLSCFRVVTRKGQKISDCVSTVVWCVHHAFIDGFSAHLLHQKMLDEANGHITYPGPSFWTVASELKQLQLARKESTRKYWTSLSETFSSAAWNIEPPSLRIAEKNTYKEGTLKLQLSHERIIASSTVIGVTPAAYYCAAWGLALSKLLNNDQVIFGMVFSGRDLPIADIQNTIGPFINTLPMFLSTSEPAATKVPSYVRKVFETLSEHSTNQLVSPEDGVTRRYSSVIAFQYDMSAMSCDATYTTRPIGESSFTMESDIPISVIILGHGEVELRFDNDRYSIDFMQALGDLFCNAMEALHYHQSSVLTCLDGLISNEAKADLLRTSNYYAPLTYNDNSNNNTTHNDDIVTLFEKTASLHSDSRAVVRGSESITYRDFNAAVDLIARALEHVRPGEPVCVLADRSTNWLAATFGILKVRGVYVPLDPNVPSSVRDENFKRCGARVYVTTVADTNIASPSEAVETVIVEHVLQENDRAQSVPYPRRTCSRPDDAAYICFTSGSTGKPKAVQCMHKGLTAFIASEEIRLHAGHGTCIAQIMSPVFDGSILEVFSALCYGATLCLPDTNANHPFEHVNECDVAIFTPSVGKVLNPQDYPKLKYVYLVGEPVPQTVCDAWSKHKILYNMYGPTEATCGATLKRLQPGENVSIGYPNPSSRVYVLDRNHQLMPAGTIGEIYIAGVQVSDGYLGQPDETDRKFSHDSLNLNLNERMYQTGDLGYWDPVTKELHCKGRRDRQIKLRGFRLDLQNLEIRIAKAVSESIDVAVYRREDFLIAVLRPASLDIASVRSRILQALPGYAAPRRIIVVDHFPLTSAGKLDYKGLESLQSNSVEEQISKSLHGTEQLIAQAWSQLLHLGPEMDIGADTTFIDLGGHSLLQIKLANVLTRMFKHRISLKVIIENQSIHSLARAIDAIITNAASAKIDEAIEPVTTSLGPHGVSPIEKTWLQQYSAGSGTSSFNVSRVYELNAAIVDYDKLCSSWDTVLSRHQVLRSRYIHHAGGVRIYHDTAPRVEFVKGLDVREFINYEFDLENECPVRIAISPRYLTICISHIVCDLTTLRLLLEEVCALYRGAELTAPTRAYQDACWEQDMDRTVKDFWKTYLATSSPISGLPLSTRSPRKSFTGTSYTHAFTTSSQRSLHTTTRAHNLTYHQAALGIVALALDSNDTNILSSDIVFGSPFLGRSEKDDSTIGLFLQPLPIRIPQATTESTLTQFFSRLRDSSQSSLANAVPWHQLGDCVGCPGDTSRSFSCDLFDNMVTFHDERDFESGRTTPEGFEQLEAWTEGAKFPLMFEFTLAEGFFLLRIEYSDELFTRERVVGMVARIEVVLDRLERGGSVGEIIGAVREGEHRAAHGREVEWGCKHVELF